MSTQHSQPQSTVSLYSFQAHHIVTRWWDLHTSATLIDNDLMYDAPSTLPDLQAICIHKCLTYRVPNPQCSISPLSHTGDMGRKAAAKDTSSVAQRLSRPTYMNFSCRGPSTFQYNISLSARTPCGGPGCRAAAEARSQKCRMALCPTSTSPCARAAESPCTMMLTRSLQMLPESLLLYGSK